MNLMLLYIDPGTGSMLFSILIGAATTLFFLSKAVWIKLKVLLSGKKNGVIQDSSYKKYVIYCEDRRYWNVFLPILQEFEKRETEITYYVSSAEDPVFSQNFKYVKPEVIGTGNSAYAKLNMMSAGILVCTTPGVNVYQWKRSKNVKHYCHIFHSTTDSSMYRLFGLDFFDSVLLTGDYSGEDIRTLEKQRGLPAKELVTVGCTYLDVLQKKIAEIPAEENHQYTVLVSPSWGKSALLSLYGERLLDPLIQTGFNIIIRPHPQSKISEAEMLNKLTERYKDKANVTWDYERDNIYSLKKADIMISDFSGIIFDYTFLGDKPVIYAASKMDLLPYDAYDIHGENYEGLWEMQTLKNCGILLEEKDFGRIKEVIQNASDSPELKQRRASAKAQAWQHIGEAGKRTADFMIETVQAQNKAE